MTYVIDDDPDREPTEVGDWQWCECGRPKTQHAHGCTRCMFLDGSKTQALVVEAMRTLGPSSIGELSLAVYGARGKNNFERSLTRMLGDMIRSGRVARREEEMSYGITNPKSLTPTGGAVHYVYFLVSKTNHEGECQP